VIIGFVLLSSFPLFSFLSHPYPLFFSALLWFLLFRFSRCSFVVCWPFGPCLGAFWVRARCKRRLGWVVVAVIRGTATALAGVWRSPPSSGDGVRPGHIGGWFRQGKGG
ncbi:hypothetical protein BDB00DRAFT_803292, partial [Zychaea mexicana]|uniref:uncharacterized protein n=1 Tax=Zychaea mexicana TaxID=64656 RepID=UPI0022FEE396